MKRYPDKSSYLYPSDELLMNPHKGFTTFQRFRKDALNDETSPYTVETAWRMEILEENDGKLRDGEINGHPDSTICYFRVPWRAIEGVRGVYDFTLIDKLLARAEERGQKALFRFPPHSARPDPSLELPDWMISELGLPKREEGDKASPLVPLFFETYSAFIRAVGEHIDGDSRVDAVDISLISAWGEGAQGDMLREDQWKMIIDAYLDSFKNTPLIAQFSHQPSLDYMLEHRPVGLRGDCLGDMRWRHMTYLYPRAFALYPDLWKKAPIAVESCWVMRHWFDMGWDLDFTIEESLRWHITSFNTKSVSIPEEYEKKVEEWIKRMGYRYAVRFVEYPGRASASDTLSINFNIQNRGVAPIYHRYPLNIRLEGENYTHTFRTDIDITEILPGNYLYTKDIPVPQDIPKGIYKLEIGITDGKCDVLIATKAERSGPYTIVGEIEII